jgi:hypothetical protein
VHRRTVRQALASAIPPPRKAYPPRPRPAIDPYVEIIDGWLLADRDAPRKQRHTARRVWQRLVAEHGATLAEVTVSRHIARRKVELGLDRTEVAGCCRCEPRRPDAAPPASSARSHCVADAGLFPHPAGRHTRPQGPPSSLWTMTIHVLPPGCTKDLGQGSSAGGGFVPWQSVASSARSSGLRRCRW